MVTRGLSPRNQVSRHPAPHTPASIATGSANESVPHRLRDPSNRLPVDMLRSRLSDCLPIRSRETPDRTQDAEERHCYGDGNQRRSDDGQQGRSVAHDRFVVKEKLRSIVSSPGDHPQPALAANALSSRPPVGGIFDGWPYLSVG